MMKECGKLFIDPKINISNFELIVKMFTFIVL